MSLLTPPLVSYAEMTTSPPCRKDLWEAGTALEWKTIHMRHCQNRRSILQPGIAWMNDSEYILANQQYFDHDVALLLATASIWPRLWQYHELMVARGNLSNKADRHGVLIFGSKKQDLLRLLELISMNLKEWSMEMRPSTWLLHEQCSMHLNVSLEDVQLLAGKEGEDECRRVFPLLKSWAKTAEARQALFHAGQILRAAAQYERFTLRDASAVAMYHASLVLWAYAVVSRDTQKSGSDSVPSHPSESHGLDFVRLDDVEGPHIRRFLVLGRGVPCIQGQIQDQSGVNFQNVPLSQPAEVMSIVSSLLQKQYQGFERGNAPLVDNLSRLMLLLGKAYVSQGKH